MNTEFDNIIRKSLEEYELPYDSAAWTSLSKKLDAKLPVNPTSNLKWWMGAGAISVVAISSIIYFSKDSTTTSSAIQTEKSKQTLITENTTTATSSTKGALTANASQNKSTNQEAAIEQKTNSRTEKKPSKDQYLVDHSRPEIISSEFQAENNSKKASPEIETSIFHFIQDICLGSSVQILNENNFNIVILHPTNSKTIVAPNKSINFEPKSAGIYKVGSEKKGAFIATQKFVVNPSRKVGFEIDQEIKYEKGIPTTQVEANEAANVYAWKFENQNVPSNEEKVKVHYFNKGQYEVSLRTENEFGCSSTETQTIVIKEDYNLLAPTAFNPEGDKNQQFIPLALLEREVDFTFSILDPENGQIVYQTNDKALPWNGIDQRTGNMVPTSSNWYWSVNLRNPEKGERANYKGIVLKL